MNIDLGNSSCILYSTSNMVLDNSNIIKNSNIFLMN